MLQKDPHYVLSLWTQHKIRIVSDTVLSIRECLTPAPPMDLTLKKGLWRASGNERSEWKLFG